MNQSPSLKSNNNYKKIHQTIQKINSSHSTSTSSYKKPISKINSNTNLIQNSEKSPDFFLKYINKNTKSINQKKGFDIDINKPYSSVKKDKDKDKHLKNNKVFIHGNDNKKINLNENFISDKIKNKNNEKCIRDDKIKNDYEKIIIDKLNLIGNDMTIQKNEFLQSLKDKKCIDKKLFEMLKEVEKNIIKETNKNNKIIVKENNEEMKKNYFNKVELLENEIFQIKNLLNTLLGNKREREENDNLKKPKKKQKNINVNETLYDSNVSNSSNDVVEIKKEIDYGQLIENIENKYPYLHLCTDDDLLNIFPSDEFLSNLNELEVETPNKNETEIPIDFDNKIELQSDNQSNQSDLDNKIDLQNDIQIENKNEIKCKKEKENIKNNNNKIIKCSQFELEFEKHYQKIENNDSMFYGIPFDSNISFVDNNTIEYPNFNINKQFFILGNEILNFNEDFNYEFVFHKIGIGILIGLVNINLTVLHNFKIQSVQSKCSILIATSSRVYNYLDNNNNKLKSKNKKEIEKIILEYNSNKKNLKFNSPGHFIHNIDLNYEKIQKDEFRIGIFFRGKNDLITMNKI